MLKNMIMIYNIYNRIHKGGSIYAKKDKDRKPILFSFYVC